MTDTAGMVGEREGVEVRLEDLKRRYGSVTALNGLSITIHPGELIALLGGGLTAMAQLPTADAAAYPAGTRARLTLRPDPVLVTADRQEAG